MEKIEKYFSDCIFTMKGASVKVAILRFFTRHGPFSHHAKFHLWLRPPSTFFGVFRDSWQILSSKIFLIFFLCKIWVIAAPNKHFLGVWYQKWMRNKLLLLHFFFYISESPKGHLNLKCIGTKHVKWDYWQFYELRDSHLS